MPLVVELWSDGAVVDGVETWWDDVELWLDAQDDRRAAFPFTASVDAYGFATVPRSAFAAWLGELSDIGGQSPPSVARVAQSLAALCSAGLDRPAAELRLVGD